MDISAAALPPRQPLIHDEDRKHPRFGEYMSYRAAMSCRLVEADSFKSWLSAIEAEAYRQTWVAHPQYADFLRWMRKNQGGMNRPGNPGQFPDNFKAWIEGARW